jgi:hypothetical protein
VLNKDKEERDILKIKVGIFKMSLFRLSKPQIMTQLKKDLDIHKTKVEIFKSFPRLAN